MAYYSEENLKKIGFSFLGKNVKISEKASIYDVEKISIGDNSRIDDFCVISGKVEIGKNVHIAPMCLIAGGSEGVFFGDFSGLAYGVKIFSQSDDYSGETMTNPTVPAIYKNEAKIKVMIGRHAIIGAGSIVMPGVDIAEGVSIGALALVHKSTTPWGLYIGNPARRVKDKSRDLLKLEEDYLKSK